MPTEKERLEQGALEVFAQAFGRFSRGTLEFVTLLSPPAPDGHCRLDGIDLFIEVAHIYGTDVDARYILQRKGNSAPTRNERLQSSVISLDRRVVDPLNRVLADKATKAYAGSPVWLLIRVGLPLLTTEDFQWYFDQIVIPADHPFEEIWLMCSPTAEFGIMQLHAKT